MKFIWSYDILCLLSDFTILISRDKFRANWCIEDILENLWKYCKAIFFRLIRYKLNEVSYKCLWYRSIYSIHRHMISIISSPAKCELRKVACSDYDTANLVCVVHKNLCSLTSLSILICNIMYIHALSDILEMNCNSISDRNLDKLCSDFFYKRTSVIVCSICCSETRHSNCFDSIHRKSEDFIRTSCN